MKPRPVLFQGHRLFFCEEEDGSGALAPPEHIGGDGNITLEAVLGFFEAPSYAHVYPDGLISRFGLPAGKRSDLVFLDEQPDA